MLFISVLIISTLFGMLAVSWTVCLVFVPLYLVEDGEPYHPYP